MKINKFKDFKLNELRNVEKMYSVNNGNRSILESIIAPEVQAALQDWISYNESECVLIGGMALSFYTIPRYTMDIDVLFLSDIPNNIPKFKHHRPGAFQHDKTHVEVETVTPKTINISDETAKAVYDTSEIHDGIRIASPSGIVALKLGRFNAYDKADISSLIKYTKIDLSPFNLPKEILDRYEEFKKSEK